MECMSRRDLTLLQGAITSDWAGRNLQDQSGRKSCQKRTTNHFYCSKTNGDEALQNKNT